MAKWRSHQASMNDMARSAQETTMPNKFFNDNATVGGGDFPVVEDGMQVCRLKEVEPSSGKDYNDPNKVVPRLKWVFEALEVTDEEGNPIRFVKFTGVSYGDDRADLTKIVDSMMGRRLTPEEFKALDLDELKAKRWNVMVELTKNGAGKDVNKIVFVKPVKTATATRTINRPTPVETLANRNEVTEGLEDPFKED